MNLTNLCLLLEDTMDNNYNEFISLANSFDYGISTI